MTYGVSHPALHPGITHDYPGPEPGHFVPEGWEELNRGICPCGEVVTWNGPSDQWVPDRSMKVLVLTGQELSRIDEIIAGAEAETVERASLCDLLEAQADTNEAFSE